MRSRARLYDVAVLVGIGLGVVAGLVFGELIEMIGLGFVVGSFVTYAFRYQAGFADPAPIDRIRRYFTSER